MDCRFQSPRSGKFVSNQKEWDSIEIDTDVMFQSPRSGKFVSNIARLRYPLIPGDTMFQSPRSGKFVSNQATPQQAGYTQPQQVSIP